MTSTATATTDEPTIASTDASTDAAEEFVYLDPGSIPPRSGLTGAAEPARP